MFVHGFLEVYFSGLSVVESKEDPKLSKVLRLFQVDALHKYILA